jgi:hypothetical protein
MASAVGGAGRYPAAVLFTLLNAIQVTYLLLVAYLLLTALVWLLAWLRRSGGPRARPALAVAFAASLVQVSLWLLVIPPLAILAARALLPTGGPWSAERLVFPSVKVAFTLHLSLAMLFALVVAVIVRRRSSWVRAKAAAYAYPPGPDIPRLVVHAVIVTVAIALVFAGFGLFPLRVLAGWGRPGTLATRVAEAVTALILTIITLGGALLVGGLRDWLHILMDVINHFYRRWEGIPLPWKPLAPVDVHEFETRQLIEHRFKAALNAVLADPTVTHLSVVVHSQGTIIAVDVLSLGALPPAERTALRARLAQLTQLHLVTMGSPLTHLYQHYFPLRYPSLRDRAWQELRGVVHRWVNLFRVDDYIGTDVEMVEGWPGSPVNVPVGVGGHTGYWRQKEVHQHLLLQPGLPPGAHAALGTPSLPG